MANSGATEGEAPGRRKAEELKRELRRFVEEILEADDVPEETYEEAERTIVDLKKLRLGAAAGLAKGSSEKQQKDAAKELQSAFTPGMRPKTPEQFLCPLSSSIMVDPVVLSSGVTFERAYIQEWLRNGKRTCPKSDQVLSNTTLFPNHLLREIISEWCADHGVVLEPPQLNPDTDCISAADCSTFSSLIADLSSRSATARKQAVKSLRHITKRGHSFRAMAGSDPTAIPQLLSILSAAGDDHELREDVVTALLNLSIHDFNKKTIGESEAVTLLIESMKTSGTPNTPANAAAALFALSALDSNKGRIGESGAISPLVELIETGDVAAKKDAGSALFSLSVLKENRTRAVRAGAVGACLAAISSGETAVGDELLSLLALLSNDQDAASEVADEGGVPLLLKFLREERNAKNVENAAVVLFAACSAARRTLREVGEDEARHGTISSVARSGTSRAMRKAVGILERLNRTHSPQFSR